MTRHLLRVEAVNIEGVVADTQQLSVIRGGSLLLLDAVDVAERALARWNPACVSRGASVGVFEIDCDDSSTPDAACSAVRRELRSGPHQHATFAVSVVPYGSPTEYPAALERLIARNRWLQMRAPSLAVPARHDDGTAGYCAVDLCRPGLIERSVPGRGEVRVSASVSERFDVGRRARHSGPAENDERGLPTLIEREARAFADRVRLTTDFELLSSWAGHPLDGKIAVIHVDGNRFGRRQSRVIERAARRAAEDVDAPMPAAVHRAIDEAIRARRRDFLARLLDTALGSGRASWMTADEDGEPAVRAEILLWGGDEITIVVPAWNGLDVLQLFFETCREWRLPHDPGSEPLTHAAGIVFCSHSAPIHRVTALSRELAGLVKEGFGGKAPPQDEFAYEVLESFDHVGHKLRAVRARRVGASQADPGRDPLVLGAGVLAALSTKLPAIRDHVARSQVARILAEIDAGHDVDVQAVIARLEPEDPATQESFAAVRSALGNGLSFLTHLWELWDYVAPEAPSEARR